MSEKTITSGNTKIVFFGNERIATGITTTAPTLKSLIESGYEVAAVVSNYEPGQSRNARELEIQKVAEKFNIPVLLLRKPDEIIDQLKAIDAELAVLVAYGRIVTQDVIDLFPKGIINIHPSLLPLHRGPTPVESVILNGDAKTGVSLMMVVKALDAGPVYAQSVVALTGKETKQELAENLLELGSKMLIELIPDIINGVAAAIPQDDTVATQDKLISKEQGLIDWSKPAVQIEREIRAFAGWPRSRAQIAGKDVVIVKAHVTHKIGQPGTLDARDGEIIVYCGQDALVLDKLKPAGKKEMTGAEFIRGYIR